MSKKAMFGGLIMVLLIFIGLFGRVTMNGEVINSKIIALIASVIVFPLIIILMGIVTGFLKESIIAFFKELKSKLGTRQQEILIDQNK